MNRISFGGDGFCYQIRLSRRNHLLFLFTQVPTPTALFARHDDLKSRLQFSSMTDGGAGISQENPKGFGEDVAPETQEKTVTNRETPRFTSSRKPGFKCFQLVTTGGFGWSTGCRLTECRLSEHSVRGLLELLESFF